ncbi:Helix-turn-helix of insertion element transposase [Seinonella peptonophila]|uniref:Helix-turn-helix of insertion element transposase n=1 Tax=Seinonella peptonophila TaxID=112248 RepID=A0A1M4VCC9_9BACL|nr:phBC6A51 family helix-turn-helix protein [Seinonella peptonophila]SHE66595.1 Helix-turn-helix of insertion element transposase [Seinonella peptonophila]
MAKKGERKLLDTRHRKVMLMLLEGGRTMQQIADEIGVNRTTIYTWIGRPDFKREYNNMVISETKSQLSDVLQSMVDAAVEDRSAAAAKIILEANEVLGKKEDSKIEVHNNTVDVTELRARIEEFQAEKNEG